MSAKIHRIHKTGQHYDQDHRPTQATDGGIDDATERLSAEPKSTHIYRWDDILSSIRRYTTFTDLYPIDCPSPIGSAARSYLQRNPRLAGDLLPPATRLKINRMGLSPWQKAHRDRRPAIQTVTDLTIDFDRDCVRVRVRSVRVWLPARLPGFDRDWIAKAYAPAKTVKGLDTLLLWAPPNTPLDRRMVKGPNGKPVPAKIMPPALVLAKLENHPRIQKIIQDQARELELELRDRIWQSIPAREKGSAQDWARRVAERQRQEEAERQAASRRRAKAERERQEEAAAVQAAKAAKAAKAAEVERQRQVDDDGLSI